MPWLRLWADILDDPDLSDLPEATCWGWALMLLVAKKFDRDGELPPPKKLAHMMHKPLGDVTRWTEELVTAGLLEEKSVTEGNGVTYSVHGWQRWQEPKDATNAARQARFKARKKSPPAPPLGTEPERDTETDTETEGCCYPSVTKSGNGLVTPLPDPNLSRIDALIPDIDETWPDANWGPFAYDLARRYLPHCVEYGFRAAIDKAWKGEQMTMRRIRGLVDWAQANGIKPDEAARIEPRNGRPPRAAEKPKTERQLRNEAAAKRRKEIIEKNGGEFPDDFAG